MARNPSPADSAPRRNVQVLKQARKAQVAAVKRNAARGKFAGGRRKNKPRVTNF